MIYDSIIIGAGPASLSAALYLKNANKNILILEKNALGRRFGMLTSLPSCLTTLVTPSHSTALILYSEMIL